MKAPLGFLLVCVLSAVAAAQTTTPDVGSGAPSAAITQLFVAAYYRNGFSNLVSLPPVGNVKKVGTNGLLQEFSDIKAGATVKLALVMPNQNAPLTEGATLVFQMQSGIYSYWNTLGSTTAGMPVIDTNNCPALAASSINTCQFQLFDKPYALFVYAGLVNLATTNFATRDPFYTKWAGYGGISALGPANSAETAITAPSGATATVQNYDNGAIYSFTSGLLNGKLIGVKPPVWALYLASGAHSGQLGLPQTEELLLPNGHKRQSFENGGIEYDPATNVATFRAAVANISVKAPANPVKLKLGDTVSLTASLLDSLGNTLTDRDILWSTSNAKIVAVVSGSATVLLKATGGGSALIRATSEGKTSTPVTVVVSAQCCQIGEGAPTAAITQAFQDAVTRNHLNLALPTANAVTRVGSGYLQQFQSADSSGQAYWIAVPDSVLKGFVLSGRFLSKYVELGGPTGTLGYPVSDATAGGRQMFEHGALAGDPSQVITGDILTKWGALGYETGIAGLPTDAPVSFLTFRATRGTSQAFRGAVLYAVSTGKVYAVTGLILSRYAAAGGPAGSIGAPANDEYGLNNRRRQDFEGGFIDYAPGDSAAQLTENARQPVITASPSAVVAGTSVRLAVGGFANDSTVRVSIAGQPDFLVKVPSGAYAWDAFVPSTSRSGSVTIRAVDAADASKSAQGTYTVRATAEVKFQFTAVSGDNQNGPPGALLPLPLVAVLKDESGNPIPGATVQVATSQGAAIASSSAVTDAAGQAAATVRLPSNEGLALVTLRANGQLLTFSAKAAQSSLANFPKLSQAVSGTLGAGSVTIAQKGAMLTAAAAIIRYHQARNEMPQPNGLADPAALNEYLKGACVTDASGAPLCDGYLTIGANSGPIVNPWRLGGFAGNGIDVSVDAPDLATVRDSLAQGTPVLLALALNSGDAHFVAASGVASSGDILIMDPNPAFGRSNLADYLNGFTAAGGTVKGTLTGALRLLPRAPKSGGFLVAANAPVEINSPAGACGASLQFPPGVSLRSCDGAASSIFQVDLGGGDSGVQGSFTDLGTPASRSDLSGTGPLSYNVQRGDNPRWNVTPVSVALLANGIVNAASFTADIAPGGIVSIFGAGFGRAGSPATVQVNGVDAKVLAGFPFQLNVQIPPGTPVGPAAVVVNSEFGSATQSISVRQAAPAFFLIGPNQAAVVNADGRLNAPANPVQRGNPVVVYGTGFGSVSPKGNLMVTDAPVTAQLAGNEVPVAFAGLTPGFIGLYQVNVTIPAATPPGLYLGLSVKQANSTSNPVQVAIQ